MPYLAGDRSMKVKLKCPCVRALKGKVVSVLSIVGPGQAEQASAPHSSALVSSPPIMMVTPPDTDIWSRESGMPRGAGCAGRFLIWAKHVDWAEERLRGHRLWCPDVTWSVHCYLWPGLAWLSWRGCHVTWHGAWQGIEHRQAPGICFISVAGCWAPVSGIQWPPVLCTSPAPAGWGPSAQPITARDPLSQPMRARAGSMPLYGSWSWSEWVMAWPAVWTSGWCWLQEALLSVPGPGLAGARSEGSIC